MKRLIGFVLLVAALATVYLSVLVRGRAGFHAESRGSGDRQTHDGWTVISSGINVKFRDVQFIDERIGWGLTKDGVWRTVDGGGEWSQVRKSPTDSMAIMPNFHPQMIPEHLQFLSPASGWVVEGDYLVHTTDAGATWAKRSFKDTVITSCFFLGETYGWCVGHRMRPPHSEGDVETWHQAIYCTNDGGLSWRLSFEDTRDNHYPLESIWANSLEDIWAVDPVLHSTDGGRTWQKVEVTTQDAVRGRKLSIRFVDNKVGWITTNEPGGYLYTSDGGRVWESRAGPVGFNGAASGSVLYSDRENVWSTGTGGLYGSTDSGRSWRKVLEGEYDSVVFLKDKGLVVAAGKDIAKKRVVD